MIYWHTYVEYWHAYIYYRSMPTASAEQHDQALQARDEIPPVIHFDVPCATAEQMDSIVYDDPLPLPTLVAQNFRPVVLPPQPHSAETK
jgi:hypothetical protein